jgi:3-oxoacyl-[acyl-carrier-protein] synthase II
MGRPVVVTGIGLVSSVGEGVEAHLAAFAAGAPPRVDAERFAPYPVHPAVPLEWDRQIPKKSDQRQMEPWQRLGVYAAGLALDSAGVKEDVDLKARMQLIVAAGGGERDYAVDGQILTGLRNAANPGAFLNERLMGDLRPTLFLAQLSNLLAGNISIVHGVTGASRTFMGEEQAGVDALRIAEARIASGQTDIMLVGGSYNAERPDILLVYRMGGFLWDREFRPVFERPAEGGGFVLGSGAAFLVLEAAEHAAQRGAEAFARIMPVGSTRTRRRSGQVAGALERLWASVDNPTADNPAAMTVLSGATGIADPTTQEHEVLNRLAPGSAPRALGDLFGHMMEAQAPGGAALGAALIAAGKTTEVRVTSVGHHRGEGLVRLVGTR